MAGRAALVLASFAFPVLAVAGGGGGTVVLQATLSGKAERPMGAPQGRGTATIRVGASRVCWTLKVTGTDMPQAAHIHKGGPGVAGPVVVALGKTYARAGCVGAAFATTRALVTRPSAYYVDVHTRKYPAGAVRGQLKGSTPAASGGYGSGDTSGGSSGGGYGGYGDYGDTGP